LLLATILVIVRVEAAVLLRVTFCAGLVVPTGWLEKVRLVGEKITVEFVPAPDRLTV
jgi:hypothetical protein